MKTVAARIKSVVCGFDRDLGVHTMGRAGHHAFQCNAFTRADPCRCVAAKKGKHVACTRSRWSLRGSQVATISRPVPHAGFAFVRRICRRSAGMPSRLRHLDRWPGRVRANVQAWRLPQGRRALSYALDLAERHRRQGLRRGGRQCLRLGLPAGRQGRTGALGFHRSGRRVGGVRYPVCGRYTLGPQQLR